MSNKCIIFLSQKVIQLTALEDSNVPTKEQWEDAIKFMEDTIALATERTEQHLSDLVGPGMARKMDLLDFKEQRTGLNIVDEIVL